MKIQDPKNNSTRRRYASYYKAYCQLREQDYQKMEACAVLASRFYCSELSVRKAIDYCESNPDALNSILQLQEHL